MAMKEINLLPKKSPEEEIIRRKKRETYVFVAAVCLAFFLVWLIPFIFLQTLKIRERSLQAAITAKEASIRQLSEQERLYKTVFHKAAAASVILDSRETFLTDLVNVEQLLTSGITMKNITLNKDKVKMSVNTADVGLVIAYLTRLEDEGATKFLKDLSIASVGINPISGYDVTLEGTLSHAQ